MGLEVGAYAEGPPLAREDDATDVRIPPRPPELLEEPPVHGKTHRVEPFRTVQREDEHRSFSPGENRIFRWIGAVE